MTTAVQYGIDFDGIGPRRDMRSATGLRRVSQRLAAMLETQRGSMWWAPERGTDLRQFINAQVDDSLSEIANAAALECEKSSKVDRAEATATSLSSGAVEITIKCQAADGPFDLTVLVTELSVTLLRS